MTANKVIKVIGSNVRKLRLKAKLSLRGLANRAQISNSCLIEVEKGNGNPLISTLHKITKSLNTNIFSLFKEI